MGKARAVRRAEGSAKGEEAPGKSHSSPFPLPAVRQRRSFPGRDDLVTTSPLKDRPISLGALREARRGKRHLARATLPPSLFPQCGNAAASLVVTISLQRHR